MILGIKVHTEFVVEFSWHEWLQEDFHLNVGSEYLFSPASVPNVFASWDHSSDVCRIWTNSYSYLMLRVMLLEIEVESGAFMGNCLSFQKISDERKVWERKMYMFFRHFCSWQIYRGSTTRKHQKLKLFVPFFLFVFLGMGYFAEVQFFRRLFSNPFHGLSLCQWLEGGMKEKASPKCRVKSTITFPGLFSLKSVWLWPRLGSSSRQSHV